MILPAAGLRVKVALHKGRISHLAAGHAELSALLGKETKEAESMETPRREVSEMNDELASRIRRGAADEGEFRRRVLEHLRRAAVRKLDVTNPPMGERIRREWGWGQEP